MLWLLGKVPHKNSLFFVYILLSALFFSSSGVCAHREVLISADVMVLEELDKGQKAVMQKENLQSSGHDSGDNKPYVAGYSERKSGVIALNLWELQAGANASGQVGKSFSITVNVVNKYGKIIPAIPTQLEGISTANSISLSWKDNGTEENGFEIERKEAGGNYELISVTEENTTSYTDETPEKGKEYYYRVRAVNTFGKSGYSNEANVKLQQPINHLPTATFTINHKTGYFPLKVTFDASDASDADGTIVTYNWDFGDGNAGDGKVITHTYEAEGLYQAALTVIDERDGSASITKEIIVLSTEEIKGTTYYVSSSDGDDDNEGASIAHPWKTLQKVNEMEFLPGDSILFKRGNVWSDNLIIGSSGIANGYIRFAAYGEGERPVFAPAYAAEVINIERVSYVSVNDIHIIAAPHEKGIRIAGDATYAIINACLVEGNATNTSIRGIEYSALSNGDYPTYPKITNCEVYNFQEGIGGYAGLHEGGYIADNYVHTTTAEGTDLIRAISGDYEGLIISHNELTGWKDDAIDLYGGSNVIIEYNHIYSPANVLSENGSGIGVKASGVGPPQSIGNIIRYNRIHHLSGIVEAVYDGINTNNGDNGKIYGNLIYAVQGHAIAISSGHDFWRIYHNTAISTEKSGIKVGDNTKNIELINNIIGGKTYDIEVNGANAIVNGYYNLLINRQERENPVGGEGIYQSITDIDHTETNGLLFRNEDKEDFQLAESGAAIDAGMTLENYNYDIQGESMKNSPDIGAFEYRGEETAVLESPFNLQANEGSEGKIELIWSDVNLDVWFVIERVTVSETDFIAIDTISAKSYLDTDVQYGIKYFYRVKAINSFTASDYSSIVNMRLEDTEKSNNLPPLASFTASVNEGIAPLEVRFDASGSTDQDGDIIFFEWDFGDGNMGNGKQITHVFASAGEYTTSLTITDDQDSVGKTSKIVNVILSENQLPIADAGEDQTILSPANELKLYGGGFDSDGEVVSYLWKQVSGPSQATIIAPAAPNTQVNELITGEYLFQLTVTDDRGDSVADEMRAFVEEEVQENQLPIAFAGEDRLITLPKDTIILTGIGTDNDGTVATYQWSYEGTDDLQLDNENESTIIVSSLTIGIHPFQFTVMDNDGGSATDEVEVIVKGSIDVIRANKAFSPNGDGIDDVWIIEDIEAIEACKLTIFNRAGQQVFEATPYHNNWDATLNGQPLPGTDYYYIIQCNSKKVKSGGIRVLR